MNNHPKWKIAAGLALLAFASSASATLVTTTDNTNNPAAFTPAWTVAPVNLISNLLPTDSFGTFTQESAAGPVKLTDGIIGPVQNTGNNTADHAIFATVGNGGGRMLIYDLPTTAANGYNITNITTFTAWGNGGRHAQAYTLYYATKASPRKWIQLGTVVYSGGFTGNNPNQPSANRVMWTDSAGAPVANNVAAIMFDLNTPTAPNGYNGYVGLSEITIEGTASATVVTQAVTIAKSNTNGPNPFNPAWNYESPSLIAGMLPVITNGNFALESPTALGSRDVGTLTVISNQTLTLTTITANNNNTTSPNYLTCGGGSGAGSTIIYTLTNSLNGSDLTNIVVYNGWADNGRHGQFYTVSYSTIGQPTSYLPISTVYYIPTVPGTTPSANRVAITATNGVPLASAVANIKFDFSTATSVAGSSANPAANAFNNGYQGYAQIIVQGYNTAAPAPPPSPFLTQDTIPTRAETIVGDQIVFSAAYSNAPPASLQWLFISGGVTNVIANATNTTLTLNNLQTNNSGSYTLKAVNATNGAAAPSFSTPAPLAVGIPPTVGNVAINYSAQAGPTNFYPAWVINTNADLIFGFPTDGSGSPGTATAGLGNYGLEAGLAGDPTILADGVLGSVKSLMVSCGPGGGAGLSMTYTLNTTVATNGFDLTNITVYGGWPDNGRNEQKYQVLYSTVAAPATFSSIGTFDYNPNFGGSDPNSTRVVLLPLAGVLAQNVYAIQIDWNLQGSQPKNGWEGYAEITVGGAASAPRPVLTQDINPLTAEDVVGSSLTLTASFTGATSYQWQKNGTNISGANSPTLTLNNLQLIDTATNGGYRLTAINGAGTAVTRGCSLVVDPAPAAVNNIIVAFANQTSDAGSFSPTWDTSAFAASLISGASPADMGPGNFNDPDLNPVSANLAGGLPVLTDADYGSVINGGPHPAFATCGPNAGQYVTYTMPASANGYSITNIVIGSGWNDDGRNANWCTVEYSTPANPTMFFPLAVVTNRPILGTKSELRATLRPAAGVMVSNVYALKFDFENPAGIPNGFSGISQLNVYGTPTAAAAPAGPVITTAHSEDTNIIWTLETPNLIGGQLPTTQGPGVFTGEGCTAAGMTDGILSFGGNANSSAGGTDTNSSVSFVTFSSAGGWNLTNIVVYTLWHDFGRDGQFYNLSYSTLAAPSTFLPLASVAYNPFVPHDGRATGNRVQIEPPIGQSVLASNVAAVKFDFTPQGSQDFSWSGYTEIVLQGTNLAAAVPTPPTLAAPKVSGGNLILTGSNGTPGAGYTWLTTTNLVTPLANWTTNSTGSLDGTGSFSNSIPVDLTKPASFFRLRLP